MKKPSAAFDRIVGWFSDPQTCHDFVVTTRWPNGVRCPRNNCGSPNVAAIERRRTWRCRACGRQFSVKVNTVFEDSRINFDKWLPTMWLVANDRTDVSSCEVARTLGVTQKTAWLMLDRLHRAMRTPYFSIFDNRVRVGSGS